MSSASRTFQNIIFHQLPIWTRRTNFSFQNRTELHRFLDLLYRVGKSVNPRFSFHKLYHLNDFDISLCDIPSFQHLLPIRVTDLLRNSPKEAWECFLQQAIGKGDEDKQKNTIEWLKKVDSETPIRTSLKHTIYLMAPVSAPSDLLSQENCTSLKCIELFVDTLLSNRSNTGELLSRVATLQSLTHLRIRKTDAALLPQEIGNLSSLVHLDLDNNQQSVHFSAFLLTALRIARQWEGTIMQATP